MGRWRPFHLSCQSGKACLKKLRLVSLAWPGSTRLHGRPNCRRELERPRLLRQQAASEPLPLTHRSRPGAFISTQFPATTTQPRDCPMRSALSNGPSVIHESSAADKAQSWMVSSQGGRGWENSSCTGIGAAFRGLCKMAVSLWYPVFHLGQRTGSSVGVPVALGKQGCPRERESPGLLLGCGRERPPWSPLLSEVLLGPGTSFCQHLINPGGSDCITNLRVCSFI